MHACALALTNILSTHPKPGSRTRSGARQRGDVNIQKQSWVQLTETERREALQGQNAGPGAAGHQTSHSPEAPPEPVYKPGCLPCHPCSLPHLHVAPRLRVQYLGFRFHQSQLRCEDVLESCSGRVLARRERCRDVAGARHARDRTHTAAGTQLRAMQAVCSMTAAAYSSRLTPWVPDLSTHHLPNARQQGRQQQGPRHALGLAEEASAHAGWSPGRQPCRNN